MLYDARGREVPLGPPSHSRVQLYQDLTTGHDMLGDRLTKAQRNHFSVLLSMMEDALARIELLGDLTRAPGGVLTLYDDDVTPEFAVRADAIIARLRDEAAALAKLLGVEPRSFSRARSIRALLSGEIVRVEDSFSAGLKGFGAMSTEVAPVLDEALGEIHRDLLELRGVLNTSILS